MKRKSITLTIAFDDDSDAVIHLPEARVLGGEQSSTLPFVLPAAGPVLHELELSPELKLLSSDRQLAQRLGYESADLLGRSFVELLHEDFRMSLLALIGQAATGASTGSQSVRLLDRQGVELPAQLELEGRFEAQRFSGFRAVLELEREAAPLSTQSHQVSRELEERLRLMLDKAPIGICVTNERGQFETVNEMFCQMLGYRPEELIGRPLTMVAAPNETDLWNERDRYSQNGSEPRSLRHVIRKDGKAFPVWADVARVAGADGRPRQAAYLQDASDRADQGELQQRLAELTAQEEELRQNTEEMAATQEEVRRVNLELDNQLRAIDRSTAVIEFDLDGNILRVNDNFLRIFGYRREEVAGRHHRMFATTEDAASPEYRDFWARLRSGRFESGEFRRVRKDGGAVWLQGSYNPILGLDGLPYKVVKFATDITDSVLKEEQLRLVLAETQAKEEELRQNSEEMAATQEEVQRVNLELDNQLRAIDRSTAVIEFDLEGNILKVNDNFLRIFGYRREEVVGRHHRIFALPEDASSMEYRDFWARLRAGRFESGTFRRIGKDGGAVWLQGSYNPILDADGKPYKVVKFATDVTDAFLKAEQVRDMLAETQAKEEELRQSGEEMAATQEEVQRVNLELDNQLRAIDRSTAVIEFDLDGKILKANDNFLQIFGYRHEDVVGRHHRMFATQEDAASQEYRDFWAELRLGRFASGEFRRIGKDGRSVWLQGSYNPILGADGKPYKVIKFATDVTAQHQIASEIEAGHSELETIFATAPVGISVTNDRGEYTFVNDTFCSIYGYDSPDDLIGKPFTLTVPTALIEEAKASHRAALLSGESGAAQTLGLTSEGKTLNLIANWTCMQNRDGETRVVTFLADVTQSKAEEERLRDLSLVASKTDNAVIIANAQGLIEWVNEGFQRITGYSYDEVRGRKPGSFLQGPETDPAAVQRIREAIAARRAIVTEILNYSKDGRPYWLYLSITPVLGENGELQKFIAIERDITEEKVLGDQLEQLSLVASKTSNAVIITDKFGAIQWVNDGFTAISGYSLDEVIGRKPGSFLQGADTDPETVQLIRQKLKGKESFSVEILNYSKDGRPYWLSLNITPILDDFGATQRFIAIEADITERKAAESRLEELSLVASETDNAVIITDKFGKLTWANAGFSKISGYSLEEALGRTPGELLQGPDTDLETARRIGQQLRAKQRVQEEILNYHKDGTPYWLSLNITPVLDDHGDVVKFIALETDITERKAAEERLRVFNEQLQSTLNELQSAQSQLVVSEKMAALGQLIAGIAHEVNTPISAVKSSARNVATSLPELISRLPELLNQLPEAEQAALREFIQRALTVDVTLSTKEERQARRAMTALFEQAALERPDELADKLVEIRIIDQIEPLLPLFKGPYRDRILETAYQLGQIKVNMNNIQIASEKTAKIITALKNYSHMQTSDQMTEISLIDNLDTVLTLYSNQFKHGIQLERDFDPVPKLPAFADELGQVWTNIIQNGIQAMKGSGTLKVSLKQAGENAVVSITDSGPGIPEHIRHRIFEPFFTTKPQGEGTGLGLDIVRKIVEKHAGRIEVDSEPGRTTFTITLPLSPAAVSQGAVY